MQQCVTCTTSCRGGNLFSLFSQHHIRLFVRWVFGGAVGQVVLLYSTAYYLRRTLFELLHRKNRPTFSSGVFLLHPLNISSNISNCRVAKRLPSWSRSVSFALTKDRKRRRVAAKPVGYSRLHIPVAILRAQALTFKHLTEAHTNIDFFSLGDPRSPSLTLWFVCLSVCISPQETQLQQRDRATRYASKCVLCFTNWSYKGFKQQK